MTLTPRTKAVLEAIRDYSESNGMSPTFAELEKILGRQVSTIHRHVIKLEELGFVKVMTHQSRGIRLVDGKCPLCGSGIRK